MDELLWMDQNVEGTHQGRVEEPVEGVPEAPHHDLGAREDGVERSRPTAPVELLEQLPRVAVGAEADELVYFQSRRRAQRGRRGRRG